MDRNTLDVAIANLKKLDEGNAQAIADAVTLIELLWSENQGLANHHCIFARNAKNECSLSLGADEHALRVKLKEAQDMVLDVFNQACGRYKYGEPPTYQHGFLGAYEDAQYKLIEWGMIREDQCQYK